MLSEFWHRKTVVFRAWSLALISILLVVVICYALIFFSDTARLEKGIVVNTGVFCAIASLASIYSATNVIKYPGVEDSSYIVPTFGVIYAALTVGLVFTRTPYSRAILLACFLASVIFFGIVRAALRDHSRLMIGVVPEGEFERLLGVAGVDWRILEGTNADVTSVDAVTADLWADLPDEWERQLASYALQGIPVYHSKHLRESLTGRVEIEHLSENTFGTLSPLYTYATIKRIIDLAAAIAALVLLAPFLAVVGLMIRLDSEGPALFRQARIGYQGKPFRVFKFRTMTSVPPAHRDASDNLPISDKLAIRDAAMTKHDDQRITRLGKFLRRTRIDELPQILNVIKGEMSWIGPRPEAQVLSQWYEQEIPFYRYRHIVRPGITGWAQVHQGHVVDVNHVQQKLHFDFYYIKNFSLWIDVVVVIRTVRTIVTGFGSK